MTDSYYIGETLDNIEYIPKNFKHILFIRPINNDIFNQIINNITDKTIIHDVINYNLIKINKIYDDNNNIKGLSTVLNSNSFNKDENDFNNFILYIYKSVRIFVF